MGSPDLPGSLKGLLFQTSDGSPPTTFLVRADAAELLEECFVIH